MDNLTSKAILIMKEYERINTIEETELPNTISFQYLDTVFLMILPPEENCAKMVNIFVEDGLDKAYPHIILNPIDLTNQDILPKGKFYSICLYESNSVIFSLMTFEEKIRDAVERMLNLFSMSPAQIEREYQKEFLYYWDRAVTIQTKELFLYIDEGNRFSKLNFYRGMDEQRYRLVSQSVKLVDKDCRRNGEKRWKYCADVSAFYIPIIDSRGVIPPTKAHPWTEVDILELIYSKKIPHIDHAVYAAICQEKVKSKFIILVFEMIIDNNIIDFPVCITSADSKKKSLRDKLFNDIEKVDIIGFERIDLAYLHHQIGNDTSLLGKKVLIIGAGSLGSYVIKELCNNGFSNFTIYDGDTVESSNMMRWAYPELAQLGGSKVNWIKRNLEFSHPQVVVQAIGQNIDRKEMINIAADYDLIIFTVGSTDVQLECNKGLRASGCKCPIFFVWLEAGGNYSHILKIECSKAGCYECLFTKENGELVNNWANRESDAELEKNTIRNGCGATRVAYGTSVVLRTVSGLLSCIKDYFMNPQVENYLLTINEQGLVGRESVYRKECRCCGHKNQ